MAPETRQWTDLEAIKRLKARYCRLADTGAWDELRALFTDDARIEFPAMEPFDDPDAFLELVRSAPATTIHHACLPEIELLGDGSARGIWATHVYLEQPPEAAEAPRSGYHGYGHYHEEYRRSTEGWQIAKLQLRFLRQDPLAPAS